MILSLIQDRLVPMIVAMSVLLSMHNEASAGADDERAPGIIEQAMKQFDLVAVGVLQGDKIELEFLFRGDRDAARSRIDALNQAYVKIMQSSQVERCLILRSSFKTLPAIAESRICPIRQGMITFGGKEYSWETEFDKGKEFLSKAKTNE